MDKPPETETDPAQAQTVVLLVDDEALVRMLGVDILEEAGFAVVEAGTADEALVALRAHPDIQVLFTDVDMPGSMNGFALARLTRERWPQVKVLVVSGKTGPGPGDLPDKALFVGKPYDPAALVRTLRTMIAAPA